jgi:tRNA(His) guanylyltransferase
MLNMNQGIGDRMKNNYEEIWKARLPLRLPTIIRLDGKSFHGFTRNMKKPFDEVFMGVMDFLASYLCDEIQTAQFAYIQSDEISILLHPYKRLTTEPWFGNEIQKMVSISAGLASSWFTAKHGRTAIFDSRVFVLPESEVVNYFIWRQQDWTRNSISMVASTLYSHKELMNKNSDQKQEMIFAKGINWGKLPVNQRRGRAIVKTEEGWKIDNKPPMFSKKRDYIDKFLEVDEE